ncbi:MAG: formylglycine-generating enzyme family protein [Spirochaetia bacterium]
MRSKTIILLAAVIGFAAAANSSASDFMKLSRVPGGTFSLQYSEASVSAFSMGTYEVTAGQFVRVYNWALENGKFGEPKGTELRFELKISGKPCFDLDNRWCYIKFADGAFRVDEKYAEYPALAVSWYGALAFCNFLSEMEDLDPCYDLTDFSCDFSKSGYRLPTFTEWEYAARYMGNGEFRYKNEYSGSADPDEVAWYADNSSKAPNASEYDGTMTHPVGSKKPNELGIYDMSGNVNEWNWDWYGGSYKPQGTDPRGPEEGTYRVVRGGSWADRVYMCRVSRFKNAKPATWCGASSCDLGFRVARSR